MVTYIIGGCLAIIFVLVAVIVLCGCVCVLLLSAKICPQKNCKCKQGNRKLETDAAQYNDEGDCLSLFTSPSHYPELTLLPKCASETNITTVEDHEKFLDTYVRSTKC